MTEMNAEELDAAVAELISVVEATVEYVRKADSHE